MSDTKSISCRAVCSASKGRRPCCAGCQLTGSRLQHRATEGGRGATGAIRKSPRRWPSSVARSTPRSERLPSRHTPSTAILQGAHGAALGSFVAIGGTEPALDVVYVDIHMGSLSLEKDEELERHRLAFEYLRVQALDMQASSALMHRIRKEL